MNEFGMLIIVIAIGVVLTAVGAVYLRRGSTNGPWAAAGGVIATSIGIGMIVYAILRATLDQGQVGIAGALIVVVICAALGFYGQERQSSARR